MSIERIIGIDFGTSTSVIIVHMFATIRKRLSKHSGFFALVFSAAIMLLYLWCGCYYSFGEEIGRSGITFNIVMEIFLELAFWLRPAVFISLSILLGYLAWQGCRRENVPVFVIILLAGLAVILLCFENRSDWAEGLSRVLFLCWPVFLTVIIGALCSRTAKEKPYSVWKVSALYFAIVLPFCWLLTDISINFATDAFRDDICELIYLLLLAEFVIWKEVYGKQEHRESRIGALLFLFLLNAGAALYLFVRNERLQEVLYYMGFPFLDGSPALRAEWTGYRRETARAFFTNDLTVLDNRYMNEGCYWVLNGSHSLASIRFHVGMLPIFIMIFLLAVMAAFLWSRSRDGGEISKCAGYFASGCLLRMAMSVVLQMNMVWSPYIEFPFTGADMPEFVVLALLLYEGHQRKGRNGG